MSAKQVGGNHYISMAIQPWDFMQGAYGNEAFINYLEMTAIKYITRRKDDRIQDVKKAIHCLEKWLEVVESECE